MIDLPELVRGMSVERTALFMGAGASIPSGGPSGSALAQALAIRLAGGPVSEDLTIAASILENRFGRPKLIGALRDILGSLEPTGGLLALPEFAWPEIYTTNFDRLIEEAFQRAGKLIVPVRSNLEYGRPDREEGTPLYKLHGCISTDRVDGRRSSMIVTEDDYRSYANFREALFKRLDLTLSTRDVLIVGHSLRDPHLRQMIDDIADLRARTHGLTGRIFSLVHDPDPDRAALIEARGIEVAFGDIDALMHEMAVTHVPPRTSTNEEREALLPPRLVATAVDHRHARALSADAVRLFNGSPASSADVHQRLTFARSCERRLIEALDDDSARFVTITGVAGVGKTTLARRLLAEMVNRGFHAWEHRPQFPLLAQEWRQVDATLRTGDARGVLLVDHCPRFLSQVNKLVRALEESDTPGLSVAVTANLADWRPRIKARGFFAHGTLEELSCPAERRNRTSCHVGGDAGSHPDAGARPVLQPVAASPD